MEILQRLRKSNAKTGADNPISVYLNP